MSKSAGKTQLPGLDQNMCQSFVGRVPCPSGRLAMSMDRPTEIWKERKLRDHTYGFQIDQNDDYIVRKQLWVSWLLVDRSQRKWNRALGRDNKRDVWCVR